MAGYPPPYPPPGVDWKAQRRMMRDQARFQRQQMRMQQRGLRRGSIVGPVFLVALGVLFLLVEMGRLSWWPISEWFARWWPLLLIAAGVVRLAEWATDQHIQQTRAAQGLPPVAMYRRGGGGVIWLLIFLAVLGGLAHVGSRAMDWSDEDRHHTDFFGLGDFGDFDRALGDPHDSDSSVTHAISADGMLTVDNPRGDVTVSGTSDDGLMHVAIHKQVYAFKDQDVAAKVRDIEPSIGGDNSRVTINVPSIRGGSHADLSIEVPRGVTVMLTADRGDVKVNALHAPVTITANHGSVDLNGLTGSTVAHMHNDNASFSAHSVTGAVTMDGRAGDVNVSDVHGDVLVGGYLSGATHVERINGSFRFHTHRTDFQMARLDGKMDLDNGADLSADQVLGPVVLKTNDRNIALERVQGNVLIENSNGSVTLTSAEPLGAIDVTNRRGSVEVGVPPNAGFAVQASTRRGDIVNDFSLAKQGSIDSPELNGTVGRGGVMVRIATTDGDVKVRKSAVASLPAVAPEAAKIVVVPDVPAVPVVPAAPKVPVLKKAQP